MFFIFSSEIISWLVILLVVVLALYLLLFTPVGVLALFGLGIWALVRHTGRKDT